MRSNRILKEIIFILLLGLPSSLLLNAAKSICEINLNGPWEMGYNRKYTEKVIVPGIHTDATKMGPAALWYRREVTLPDGNWKYATLELKGARFSPEVYINGVSVSKQNGGMAPTFHLLKHKDVKPGRKIIIEIALTSLKDLSPSDASYIPVADQWRSNISSSLWNDVVLKVHGDLRIDRIIPFVDFKNHKADFSLFISNTGSYKARNIKALVEVLDFRGKVLVKNEANVKLPSGRITVLWGTILEPWSPEHPNLYRAKLSLIEGKDTIDQSLIPFGIKDFLIKNKQFYLNGEHITLLGGTVVWHRWVRDKEASTLAYDTAWFTQNVILRSKEHGANYLRFHLGVPPEVFLDLCDKYGLAVQYEWSFFHGMPATRESLLEQYSKWLDLAMKHPSVVLYHPYNETEGDQLKIVWDALNTILADYPPLVMEDRDVIHVHKYWWSLFENLGLYYDSADQFPKTIMVDEFGGDYLDGDGMMGGYSTESETFLRFLGRNHTKESRLALQNLANGKVAEYWRRIGAAGASPFCILGSWNDGCHWFLGNLSQPEPKPVWNALTSAWSPQSVSIELWDRNFAPGQMISVPLYLFNDTRNKNKFNIILSLKDRNGKIFLERSLTYEEIPSFTTQVKNLDVILPSKTGKYVLSAELMNRPEAVKYPVVSQWEINIFVPQKPEILLQSGLSVAADEPEIIQFLKDWNIRCVPLSDPSSKIIMLSRQDWDKIASGDKSLIEKIEQAINKGTSIIMLDVGECYLGQGYPLNKNDLGPLQGVAVKSNTPVKTYNLFGGIRLSFSEAAEPESHIHADKNNSYLWKHIPPDHTWLWNGLRGGLIVPATNFEFGGMSSSAFLSQWLPRGADEKKIKSENYYAYSLEGFYEFSGSAADNDAKTRLKKKVTFLVEDAPALANSLNPSAPAKITDLSKEYRESQNGMGENLTPLVNAGKNLTRTPVIMIGFGKNKGKLIVSQLLTTGRLAKGFGERGLYGIRFDPVANQFVFNMMELVLENN
jgi:beta-galactosidase